MKKEMNTETVNATSEFDAMFEQMIPGSQGETMSEEEFDKMRADEEDDEEEEENPDEVDSL